MQSAANPGPQPLEIDNHAMGSSSSSGSVGSSVGSTIDSWQQQQQKHSAVLVFASSARLSFGVGRTRRYVWSYGAHIEFVVIA